MLRLLKVLKTLADQAIGVSALTGWADGVVIATVASLALATALMYLESPPV